MDSEQLGDMIRILVKLLIGVIAIPTLLYGCVLWANFHYENREQAILKGFVRSQLAQFDLGTGKVGSVECYPHDSYKNNCVSIRYVVSTEVCQDIYEKLTEKKNYRCRDSAEAQFMFRGRIIWFMVNPYGEDESGDILLYVE